MRKGRRNGWVDVSLCSECVFVSGCWGEEEGGREAGSARISL